MVIKKDIGASRSELLPGSIVHNAVQTYSRSVLDTRVEIGIRQVGGKIGEDKH
jgi:hypothetical protein